MTDPLQQIVKHMRSGTVPRVPGATSASLVLFAGASGTGKTKAAEIIARELELDILLVDLSAVVSKYIGETETEKNLRRIQ